MAITRHSAEMAARKRRCPNIFSAQTSQRPKGKCQSGHTQTVAPKQRRPNVLLWLLSPYSVLTWARIVKIYILKIKKCGPP